MCWKREVNLSIALVHEKFYLLCKNVVISVPVFSHCAVFFCTEHDCFKCSSCCIYVCVVQSAEIVFYPSSWSWGNVLFLFSSIERVHVIILIGMWFDGICFTTLHIMCCDGNGEQNVRMRMCTIGVAGVVLCHLVLLVCWVVVRCPGLSVCNGCVNTSLCP